VKTPSFWSSNNTLSNILLPFSFLYELASQLRNTYTIPAKFPIPIICIGNITAGGSGKTPVALHIGQFLKDKNINAFFLSRGYGGALKGPIVVDTKKHSAHEVGDEPLLLARVLPTVVAKNRVEGARLALQKGARLIIMDDGFQNPSIAKTLSILVIDGRIGFGNGRVLPAGPLREKPSMALKRAHAAIVLNRSTAVPPLPPGMLVLNARTQMKDAEILRGKKLFAFCGLAYPQKFFDMLTAVGAQLVGTQAFADHYAYQDADLNKLLAQSITRDAALITTPKDAVRIPIAFKDCVAVIDMAIEFDDERMLDGMMEYVLNPTV